MPDQKKIKPYVDSSYIYSDTVIVTASSNNRIIFPVDLSFDFIATAFSYKSQVTNAGTRATFNIMIKNNDRQVFQNPVPNELFAGIMFETAAPLTTTIGLGLWHRFEKPFVFKAKSDIVCIFYNTVAFANTIVFSLQGYKREKRLM